MTTFFDLAAEGSNRSRNQVTEQFLQPCIAVQIEQEGRIVSGVGAALFDGHNDVLKQATMRSQRPCHLAAGGDMLASIIPTVSLGWLGVASTDGISGLSKAFVIRRALSLSGRDTDPLAPCAACRAALRHRTPRRFA